MKRDELIKKLKQYFKIEELVCSHVYNKYREEQMWSFFSMAALETLLVLREYIIQKPFIINNWKSGGSYSQRGLRCNICAIPKEKTNLEKVYMSAHCFDIQTEILTNRGWKNINELSITDLVYNYNIEKKIIEKNHIEKIFDYIYKGDMVKVDTTNADLFVTDEHRFLLKSPSRKYVRKTSKIFTENQLKYFETLKTGNEQYHFELAKDTVGKNMKFLCAGLKSSSKSDNEISLLKMCIAVICDGSIYGKDEISFKFKKERKCLQLENVLDDLNWKYSKIEFKDGVIGYRLCRENSRQIISIIGYEKLIPEDWLELDSYILKELVFYYAMYDGYFDKRKNSTNIQISSVNKKNIDFLQIMCVLSGMRAQCKLALKAGRICYIRSKKVQNTKDLYTLSICPNINETYITRTNTSIEKYEGRVWCIQTQNSTAIVRRNGKVSIQGNCTGEAFDITVQGMSAEEARQLIIKNKDNLPYPIRLEDGVSWLHIDTYDMGNGKKITLFRV